jgi:hypothetical protein
MYTEFFKSQINYMVNYSNVAHKLVLIRIVFQGFFWVSGKFFVNFKCSQSFGQKVQRSQSFDSQSIKNKIIIGSAFYYH